MADNTLSSCGMFDSRETAWEYAKLRYGAPDEGGWFTDHVGDRQWFLWHAIPTKYRLVYGPTKIMLDMVDVSRRLEFG